MIIHGFPNDVSGLRVGLQKFTIFELMSSDNGQFGMNTPGFFAIDEVIAAQWEGVNSVNVVSAAAYPNPSDDKVVVETAGEMMGLTVIDALGAVIYKSRHDLGRSHEINTSQWLPGVYQVSAALVGGEARTVIVKR